MSEKVVILGAGFLGVNAALDLLDSGKEVVLVDRNHIHQYIPGTIDLIRNRLDREDLELDLEEFMPEEIELVEAEVENVRTDEKTVETKHGLIGYDKLVVGLGGQPKNFGKDISTAEHVWGTEPAQRLSKKVEKADSAAIVGAGYVGIEVAGELAEKGVETTLLEARTRPMCQLNERSSEKILKILNQKEIEFKGGKKVSQVSENSVKFEEGEEIETDIVIWSAGVKPSETVKEAFSTGRKGLEVNSGLSLVGDEDVFAGGDCIEMVGPKTAHRAMDQGEVIAENILTDKEPLEEATSEQKFLVVSIGDEAGLVYKDRLVLSAGFLRHFKDLIMSYYFTRLKLKKKLANVDFLP